jgi:hypothetical protein
MAAWALDDSGCAFGLDGVGRVDRKGLVTRERRGRARVTDDSGCALGSMVWAGLTVRALRLGGDAGGADHAAGWDGSPGPG